jgi:hypothetical protein
VDGLIDGLVLVLYGDPKLPCQVSPVVGI